jgi:hypothetical protein
MEMLLLAKIILARLYSILLEKDCGLFKIERLCGSVPDLDPPDPHVFGPPGSGSTSQMYGSGSGSGSLYHHAKIVRKTLIPSILVTLVDFLSLKNDVNVPSKSNKQKKLC